MIIKPTVSLVALLLPLSAFAELQSLDEYAMSAVSGQSGITIEMEAQMDIGEIIYTDEGSLAITEVFLGGADRDDLFVEGYTAANGGTPFIQNVSSLLDDLKLDIDISEEGELSLRFYPVGYAAPVDFSIRTEAWEIRDANNDLNFTLIDNFKMDGIFTQLWATIGHDEDLGADKLHIDLRMGIDDMDFDMPALGLGIRDFRMTRSDYDDNPNLLSANAQIEADIYSGQNSQGGGALAIDNIGMNADITVGSIQVGGRSIGSMKVDNLNMVGGSLKIYGH